MTVDNLGFLLDRLGQDCHPLQFVRELTQNSIEAIVRSSEPGEIIWDVDWVLFQLATEAPVQKLCITDTGDGMTGDQMVQLINRLSSSLSEQSLSGNYGVGAKIAAATRNHVGVQYCSWKDGDGAFIHLLRDAKTGQYGLKQFELADGSFRNYKPLADDVKPTQIDQHGTKVTLHGNLPYESTMEAPKGASSPSRWISKYLNTRYFRFPPGVTVRAREGWQYPATDTDKHVLRTIQGQERYLTDHSEAHGSLDLTEAVAHWWILRDETAISSNSGFVESNGHVAALYQDELFEMLTSSRGGVNRLQQFGITFGYKYVVIYVEPTPSAGHFLTTDTARTELLVDSEPLPWSDWAIEFRERMPTVLREFVDAKAQPAEETDHTRAIKDRLKDLMLLYKLSRYKPVSDGPYRIDDRNTVTEGREPGGSTGVGGAGGSKSTKSRKDPSPEDIYALFEADSTSRGQKVKHDPFPIVKWVSIQSGTREVGVIEDRAASYISTQNLLLINRDFRGFRDMLDYFEKQFPEMPGAKAVIDEAVRSWFEQALVETVIGVQGLRNAQHWSVDDIDKAVSDEALTAAVMQRYHVIVAVKREIGSRLGKLKTLKGAVA